MGVLGKLDAGIWKKVLNDSLSSATNFSVFD